MAQSSFFKKILSPLLIVLVYLVISEFSFIALITVVTSVVVTNTAGQEQLNQINEITDQYIFVTYALAALTLFLLGRAGDKALGRKISFWPRSGQFIWSLDPVAKSQILRGIGSGILIPLIVVTLLVFSGQLQFHGTFVLSDLSSPIFLLFLANVSSIFVLVISEEYIFRHKVLRALSHEFNPVASVIVTSLAYVLIKTFQFKLSPEDHVSLFIINIALGFYFLRTGRVFRGLTFLTSLYAMIHLVCGLPLWGQKGAGLFLITDSAVAFRSVTGGGLGPLSGVALIALLLLVAGTSVVLWRKDATRNSS